VGGAGGAGVASTITGSSVTRAGGGGAGGYNASGGSGGAGGGGNGSSNAGATAGTVNTGGGGGASGASTNGNFPGGAGGSGIVVLSYPSTYALNIGAGLTATTTTVGANKVTSFTAGTGNVSLVEAGASAFVLIETVNLTSSASSVTISNLAQYAGVYEHLQIRAAIRGTGGGDVRMFLMQFNGDTGSNYNSHMLYSDGPGSLNNGTPTSMWWTYGANSGSPASAYSAVVTDILDFTSTTKNKTVRTLGGGPNGYNMVNLISGLWRNTNAVTSITLTAQAGDSYAANTRISIYGVK
jgi:hypothetical protein